MFGELNDLSVNSALSIVPYDALASSVGEHARKVGAQLVLVPWLPAHTSQAENTHNAIPGTPRTPAGGATATSHNPFDALFRTGASERSASVLHSHFIRGVFHQAGTDVALFVDRTHPARTSFQPSGAAQGQHLFLPFFGGPDDRLALDFVVQLCANPKVSATVVRVIKRDVRPDDGEIDSPASAFLDPTKPTGDVFDHSQINSVTVNSTVGFPDTVYGNHTTQTRLQSETADSVAWERYAAPRGPPPEPALAAALSRVAFQDLATPVPLHAIVQHGVTASAASARLMVVLGRSRRLAVEDHHQELKEMMDERPSNERVGSEVKKTLGDVATAFVLSGVHAGLIVMQAATVESD
ncbi:hypothetical protein OF83DRAFT_1173659 [Amylostereum chailletii]|nr:hypothetical protein OF83DRAFT_1173659 [Amylostereum chailletii]